MEVMPDHHPPDLNDDEDPGPWFMEKEWSEPQDLDEDD